MLPDSVGFYWWRRYPSWSWEIVRVRRCEVTNQLMMNGWEVSLQKGEWGGRIPEPNERTENPPTASEAERPSDDEVLDKILTEECFSCGVEYGSPKFPELIIEDWAWWRISPDGEGNGLLCPSCICGRLTEFGIECKGVFKSGPLYSDEPINERRTQQEQQNLSSQAPAIEGSDCSPLCGGDSSRTSAAQPTCKEVGVQVESLDPAPAPAGVRCFRGVMHGFYVVSPSGAVTFFTKENPRLIQDISHITTSEIIAESQIEITPAEALALLPADWAEGREVLEKMLTGKEPKQ